MIQRFLSTQHPHVFEKKQPRLVAISKIDAALSLHPRIMHSHKNEAEVLYVRSGKGVYVINDTRYEIEAGDLVICNKNVLHDEEPNAAEDLSTYCLTITNLSIQGLEDNCLIPSNIKPVIKAKAYQQHFEMIFDMMFELIPSPEASEAVHHMMIGLMSLLQDLIKQQSVQEDEKASDVMQLCRMTKDYINNHYTEDLTLGKIAKAMSISPSYLSHVFKEHIGYSIMNYTLRRRIGESQTLLINTQKTITEIASDVGYANPNYFNVVFTKYVGMAPSKYRKQFLTQK